MDDLIADFIAETRETLEALTGELIAWEAKPGDRALLDSAFRFFHTVKGSCGFLQLPRFERLSHAAEDLLGAVRAGERQADAALVDTILALVDRIALLTDALADGREVMDDDAPLLARIATLSGHDIPPPLARCDTDVGARLAPVPGAAPAADDTEDHSGDAHTNRLRTVRVPLAVLDRLMTGISDLVLARNELSRHLRSGPQRSEIEHSFSRLSASIADTRDVIGLMRLQRIDRLFNVIPRMVRDVAATLGKQVTLTFEGGDVEIDREMIEAIRDPITHMLRNSIDHGIESPDERVAAGKPPAGRIHLSARQSGNQILIEIADDGRGIDTARLVDRAIAVGAIDADGVRSLSPAALLDLIFTPGLSTAREVGALSGRGVGMDVVRTNIRALGGTIELENQARQGLRIRIRVPLTLSIIPALTVRIGEQMFAVARNAVVELLRHDNTQLAIAEAAGARIATVRGRRRPYGALAQILGMADTEPTARDTSACVLILKSATGSEVALGVDAVIDHEELVVRPAPPLVMAAGVYAGMALPDSGQPLLLLDVNGLARAIGADSAPPVADDEAVPAPSLGHRDSALLFLDLDGRLRATRLAIVERMLDVDAGQIIARGGQHHFAGDDDLGIVIGFDPADDLVSVKLLRLSDGHAHLFLAVAEVMDIFAIGTIRPARDPAVEGLVTHDGETIELLDCFQLLARAHIASGRHDADGEGHRVFLAPSLDDGWGRGVLVPLLEQAGYAPAFAAPTDPGAVMIARTADQDQTASIRLCDRRPAGAGRDSIFMHDRQALLDAVADAVRRRA